MKVLIRQIILGLGLWLGTTTAIPAAPPATNATEELMEEGKAFASSGKLEAAAWAYRKAAKTGNLNATFAAGDVLFLQAQSCTGRERILKLAEGLGYLFSAATNRHAQACAELANALQNGIGVATNMVGAYAWLAIAAQCDPTYRSELDKLVIRLEPSEIIQAQRIAHDYLSGRWPSPVARPVEQGDSRLQIQGMTVGKKGALIILNGGTLGVGETIDVRTANNGGGKLVVSCFAIAPDHVLIEVAGEPNLKLLAINSRQNSN
ncbi:MAG: hypothetical protein WCH99_10560 [Verrucomicrobiota bacterium]